MPKGRIQQGEKIVSVNTPGGNIEKHYEKVREQVEKMVMVMEGNSNKKMKKNVNFEDEYKTENYKSAI